MLMCTLILGPKFRASMTFLYACTLRPHIPYRDMEGLFAFAKRTSPQAVQNTSSLYAKNYVLYVSREAYKAYSISPI